MAPTSRVGTSRLVVFVRRVVDARQQRVVAGKACAGIQVEQRVAAEHLGIGRIVKAAARGLHFGTQGPAGKHRVGAQHGVALGAPCQLLAGIAVVRVLEVHRTTQLHAGELVGTCQRDAAVLGIAGVEVAAKRLPTGAACGKVDQVGHAVAVHHRREGACALPIAQAQLSVAAGLGLQRGVAVLAEALVQRGRTKCRARRCGGAPARCKGVAVGQAAGALAAEFAVAVVAQVGLHAVRACAETVAQRQRVLRTAARGATHQRGVFKLVLTALQRSAQTVRAQTPVVLPQVAAQLRLREVGRGCGLVAAERLVHRNARAVGVAPLGGPVRARRVQAVEVAVVVGRRRLVSKAVVA